MDTVRGGAIGQTEVVILDKGLGDLEVIDLLFLGHVENQLVKLLNLLIGDIAVGVGYLPGYREDFLHIDDGVGVNGPDLLNNLGELVDENTGVSPAQLIDAKHEIHLGELGVLHGLHHRHSLPIEFHGEGGENGVHHEALFGIAGGVAQASIQHQSFGTGVAQEHGVIQIALVHAAGFRHRLGEVIGQGLGRAGRGIGRSGGLRRGGGCGGGRRSGRGLGIGREQTSDHRYHNDQSGKAQDEKEENGKGRLTVTPSSVAAGIIAHRKYLQGFIKCEMNSDRR